MMLPGRQLAEALLKILHRTEAQVRQLSQADDGWDIDSIPIPRGKVKAYAKPRDVDELDLIVVHVTAVRGGFGVSKRAIKRWKEAIDRDLRDWPLLAFQLGGVDGVMGLPFADVAAAARRLATWERYRSTPYHQIGSQMGDAIANRRIEQVSWHGNGNAHVGGNAGVGMAFDSAPDEDPDEWLVDRWQTSLEILGGRVLRASERARRHGIRIVPHRAYSAARRGDTGAMIWQRVVLPVVARSEGVIRVDYEAQWGGGLPVPDTWDERALYDVHGRPL